jgi:fatty acid desaturase
MFSLFVSPGTFFAIVAGTVISVFYLYYMGAALQRSVRTRDQPDETHSDRYAHSFIGAILSVIASIASIAIYGYGPWFLYWGPVLAGVAAIAVAYSLREELLT